MRNVPPITRERSRIRESIQCAARRARYARIASQLTPFSLVTNTLPITPLPEPIRRVLLSEGVGDLAEYESERMRERGRRVARRERRGNDMTEFLLRSDEVEEVQDEIDRVKEEESNDSEGDVNDTSTLRDEMKGFELIIPFWKAEEGGLTRRWKKDQASPETGMIGSLKAGEA